MTSTATRAAGGTVTRPPGTPPQDHRRQLNWRRLSGIPTTLTLIIMVVSTIGVVLGTVVAGQLAAHPTTELVWVLTMCVVGGALLDTVGRFFWASIIDRAEGSTDETLG